jgi:hypothetical protein
MVITAQAHQAREETARWQHGLKGRLCNCSTVVYVTTALDDTAAAAVIACNYDAGTSSAPSSTVLAAPPQGQPCTFALLYTIPLRCMTLLLLLLLLLLLMVIMHRRIKRAKKHGAGSTASGGDSSGDDSDGGGSDMGDDDGSGSDSSTGEEVSTAWQGVLGAGFVRQAQGW